jgi:hypothetical protein
MDPLNRQTAAPDRPPTWDGRAARAARIPIWLRIWLLFCTAILAFGVFGLLDMRALRSRGAIATATVVDWREDSGRHQARYKVRYQFQLPGDPESYSTGDGWEEVSRETWELTKRTRRLLVRYLPDAPGRHLPNGEVSTAEPVAILVASSFMYALGLLWLWKERQEAWPTPPAPPPDLPTGARPLRRFEFIRPRRGPGR